MNTPDQPTTRTNAAWAKTFESELNQFWSGNAANQMRDECATLERELTAERERVRVLREHGVEALMVARSWQMVWGDKLSTDSVAIFTKHEQAFISALAATEAKP